MSITPQFGFATEKTTSQAPPPIPLPPLALANRLSKGRNWLWWFRIRLLFAIIISVAGVVADSSYWHMDRTQLIAQAQREGVSQTAIDDYAKHDSDTTNLAMFVQYFLDIGKAVFMVLIGGAVLIQLLRKNPNALTWVTWFLILRAMAECVALYFNWSTNGYDKDAEYNLLGVLECLVWLSYFAKSEYVRLTFGRRIFDRKLQPAEEV